MMILTLRSFQEKTAMFLYLSLILFKEATLEVLIFIEQHVPHAFSLFTYEYSETDNKQLFVFPRLEPRPSDS